MKRILPLAWASLLAVAAIAPSTKTDAKNWHEHWSCAATSTDTPPPIECPFCGGDAEVHRQRVKALIGLQASVMLITLATH